MLRFFIRIVWVVWLVLPQLGLAQQVLLKGKVTDQDGQPLPLAHIDFPDLKQSTVTDNNGHFSAKLTKGICKIHIRYVSFQDFVETIQVFSDTFLVFKLLPSEKLLEAVEVVSEKYVQSDMLQTTRMSTLTVTAKEINSIPVLGGEADVLKTLQLLPGTSKGVEGSTDLFVRGGAADQNLVLFDGATVYNTGHLFGFLSVFHPDILDRAESINGAFPAHYGGRLSSIIDVTSKQANAGKTRVKGNVGIIASRLLVEKEIIPNKLGIWVAGRRTYIDQVLKLLGQNLPYFFYDANAKITYSPTPSDVLEFSTYLGDDKLDFSRSSARNITSNFIIGNNSQTLRWGKKLTKQRTSELLLFRTAFRYDIRSSFEDSRLQVASCIADLGTKWTYSMPLSARIMLNSGAEITRHAIDPSVISTSGELSELLESSSAPEKTVLENALFTQAQWDGGKAWAWSAGLRLSSAWVGQRTYIIPEPRLALRYSLQANTTLKASYSRMAQYLHRVSSSSVTLPTDIWYPVTPDVRPQTAHQVTLALQRSFPSKNLFLSVETYYKDMKDLVGYLPGTNLTFNTDFESKLIQGKGRAYGLEILLKKEKGKLTGWIGYTLSRTERSFDEIEHGAWFLARYDRRHNGSIVANYELGKRITLSAVFEFISGSRFTPIIGQYGVLSPTGTGVTFVPIYAPLNSVKLADTHRLDLGLKLRSKPRQTYKGEWFFGVYNVYNRAMPYGISIQPRPDGTLQYQQPGLFGLIPTVSYGFEF